MHAVINDYRSSHNMRTIQARAECTDQSHGGVDGTQPSDHNLWTPQARAEATDRSDGGVDGAQSSASVVHPERTGRLQTLVHIAGQVLPDIEIRRAENTGD